MKASDAVVVTCMVIVVLSLIITLVFGITELQDNQYRRVNEAVQTIQQPTVARRDQNGLRALTDAAAATVCPGVITDEKSYTSPYVLIDGYVDGTYTRLRISSTFAGVYIPGKVGDTISLDLVLVSLATPCSSTPEYTGTRATLGNVLVSQVPPQDNTNEAIVGFGPAKNSDGTYASPILATIARTGRPLAWAFNVVHKPHTYLSFTIPRGECFQWCWSPLTVDTDKSEYVVPLEPSVDSPWTSAVIGIGHWKSTLPGASSSGNESYILKTKGGCTFYIRPGTYETAGPSGPSCRLGISAGLAGGALCVDLNSSRLGYVPVLSSLG